jgi:hypothetical protein
MVMIVIVCADWLQLVDHVQRQNGHPDECVDSGQGVEHPRDLEHVGSIAELVLSHERLKKHKEKK